MLNNIYCPIYGGGIFSKVMLLLQIIEHRIPDIAAIDNIYALNADERIDPTINPFNYIYSQNDLEPRIVIPYSTHSSFTNEIPDHILMRLKSIVIKLKANDEVGDKFLRIFENLNYGDNVLGVHLRLTDMNSLHGDMYGNKSFEHYVNAIDDYLNHNKIDQIYVAADNNESLNKLISIYGDKIIYYRDFIRPDSENATVNFQLDNFSDKRLWQDSFIDMLLLAQSTTLIHRVSNFANAAKVYSNSIKKSILI